MHSNTKPKLYTVTVIDGGGKALSTSGKMRLEPAVEDFETKKRQHPTLRVVCRDVYDNLVPDPRALLEKQAQKPAQPSSRSAPTAEDFNRRYAEERKLERMLAQQVGDATVAEVEIHDRKGKLYGMVPYRCRGEWDSGPKLARSISLKVATPDVSQRTRAVRDAANLFDEIPVTAQAKAFTVEAEVVDGLLRQVAYIDPVEVWTALRDGSFRRRFPPSRPEDLSTRDLDIFENVRKFRKLKPGGGQEQEAEGLITAGLLSMANGVWHLTQLGSEFQKAAQAARGE